MNLFSKYVRYFNVEYAFSNDICFQMFSFSVPLGCAPFREAAHITACVSFSRNVCIDVHSSAACSHAGQVRTAGRMWAVRPGSGSILAAEGAAGA